MQNIVADRLSQTLNEIMPMIYRRFTEKSAEEWRQIYKALQLLEFLIKHGSERVIDDARGHLTLLKMLRQFHFIDQNGKDQGINVRNRAKELAELLGDVERIRIERKKARNTKNKYTGVEGGTFSGGFSSGGASRYGGFGSESAGDNSTFGGFSGGVYGDGGGFGGQDPNDFRSGGSRSDRFEEYDEGDDGPAAGSSRSSRRTERASKKATAPPPKKKEPEVDLFSFDEPEQASAPAQAAAPSNGSGLADLTGPSSSAAAANDEDEFDDFQSAAPAAPAASSNTTNQPLSPPSAQTTAQFAAPQPQSGPQQANISQMVSMSSISPSPSASGTPGANYSAFNAPSGGVMSPGQAPKPTGFQQSGPNYFGGIQTQPSGNASGGASGMAGMSGFSSASNTGPSTMANTKPVTSPSAPTAAPAGGDAFGALWGKASSGIKKQPTTGSGPAMGQLAKEKSAAGIWGAPASSQPPGGAAPQGGSASDDLLG